MSERTSPSSPTRLCILAMGLVGLMACSMIERGNERHFYGRARQVFRYSVSDQILAECGERLALDYPSFFKKVTRLPGEPVAEYWPNARLIEYDPNDLYTIVHEGTHDILAFQNEHCLRETAAYYAERIVRLEDENQRLRQRR